jgi:hypothetical protein
VENLASLSSPPRVTTELPHLVVHPETHLIDSIALQQLALLTVRSTALCAGKPIYFDRAQIEMATRVRSSAEAFAAGDAAKPTASCWGGRGTWSTLVVIFGFVVILHESVRLDKVRPGVMRQVNPDLMRTKGGGGGSGGRDGGGGGGGRGGGGDGGDGDGGDHGGSGSRSDDRAASSTSSLEPLTTPAVSPEPTTVRYDHTYTTRKSEVKTTAAVAVTTVAVTQPQVTANAVAATAVTITSVTISDSATVPAAQGSPTASCADTTVVARTGAWSRAGQRLGNTLCMLGRALREAEDAGGGVLELMPPGSRFYNATTFCVSPSADSVGRARPEKVLEGTFSCYTPCTCGAGNFKRFRNVLQRYVVLCE